MHQKEHPPTRLEPELLGRLRRVAYSKRAPISDTISLALDPLEKEKPLVWRLENMEVKLVVMEEILAHLDHKMDGATFKRKGKIDNAIAEGIA